MIFVNIIKAIGNFIINHPVYTSTTLLLGFLNNIIIYEIGEKIRKKGYKLNKTRMKISTFIFHLIATLTPILNICYTLYLSKQLNDEEEKLIKEIIYDKDSAIKVNTTESKVDRDRMKDTPIEIRIKPLKQLEPIKMTEPSSSKYIRVKSYNKQKK